MASLCLPTAKVGEGLVVLRDLIGQSSVSMKMNQWTAVRGSSDWLIGPKVHRPTGENPRYARLSVQA